jgi:glucosamine--fructose-6-phosphate aminotransferase (isomerizing)
MCGIVGYIGKNNGVEPVLAGLKALEYRGYDSAGIACIDGDNAAIYKQVGEVKGVEDKFEQENGQASGLVIGHTRWATHGTPTVANAHPHQNTDGSIFVVHNGIIENYQEIRDQLKAEGYEFVTETDTEVIPHLIDYHVKNGHGFKEALEIALQELRGAYAVAAISSLEPDTLYAARLSSPLVVGIGDGEFIMGSDPAAVLPYTKEVLYLDDYELIALRRDGTHEIVNFKEAHVVMRDAELLDIDAGDASLGTYPHFMLKEIHEAPATIRSATRGRIKLDTSTVKLGGLESVQEQLKYIDRIVIVACGTSYYAGLVGEYLIEELAGIPVEVQLASEFKYRHEPFSRSTALIAISQSGETADTIAALKKVEDYGVLRLGVVNAVGSTIARMTDAGVYCHAGPEQAVASTKAFIAQVTVLSLIALHLSNGNTPLYKPMLEELAALPAKAEAMLASSASIETIASKYKDERDFLFMGRGYEFPSAMEGALKLKEVSYIHAEGYAAGEMKHGPLAMIDEHFPSFVLATDSPLLEKVVSNIEEIRARKGRVVAVATEGNSSLSGQADDVMYTPKTLEQTQPLLTAIVMQLFSYHIATARGLNVDRPRNLAKSVTVE